MSSKAAFKIGITEVELGWAFIFFKDEKPAAPERRQWLERALRDWIGSHPGYKPIEVQPIEHAGELYGLNAWCKISANVKVAITFDVTESALAEHSREYLEAVMGELTRYLKKASLPPGQLAVTNRRGVAFIVNSERNRARVMPLTKLEIGLSKSAQAALRRWQQQERTKFLVLPIRILGDEHP